MGRKVLGKGVPAAKKYKGNRKRISAVKTGRACVGRLRNRGKLKSR